MILYISLYLVFLLDGTRAQLTCNVDTVSGCYTDMSPFTDARVFHFGPYSPISNSLESCAVTCSLFHSQFSGVENGTLCYCGNEFNPLSNSTKVSEFGFICSHSQVPMSQCASPCPGNNSEACGGSNRLLVYTYKCKGLFVIPVYLTARASHSVLPRLHDSPSPGPALLRHHALIRGPSEGLDVTPEPQ